MALGAGMYVCMYMRCSQVDVVHANSSALAWCVVLVLRQLYVYL